MQYGEVQCSEHWPDTLLPVIQLCGCYISSTYTFLLYIVLYTLFFIHNTQITGTVVETTCDCLLIVIVIIFFSNIELHIRILLPSNAMV